MTEDDTLQRARHAWRCYRRAESMHAASHQYAVACLEFGNLFGAKRWQDEQAYWHACVAYYRRLLSSF